MFAADILSALRANRALSFDTFQAGAAEGRRAKVEAYEALVQAARGPSADELRVVARDAVRAKDLELYSFACRVFHESGFAAGD